MDVIKTRIMSATKNQSSTASAGALKMMILIVKEEGPRALFKGWLPAYSRLGPQTILTFIFLEMMKKYYRQRYA